MRANRRAKIPLGVKKVPRCPLCYAVFAEEFIPSRRGEWWTCGPCNSAVPRKKGDPNECPSCHQVRFTHFADGRAFLCHFCKIVCMANDPFVGRWEELLAAQGEKVLCPNEKCQTEMRGFFTSTGYVRFQCPVKTCMAKIETAAKDRREGQVTMLDKEGEPVVLPGIDRPIATPEAPSAGQIGDAPPEDLPAQNQGTA